MSGNNQPAGTQQSEADAIVAAGDDGFAPDGAGPEGPSATDQYLEAMRPGAQDADHKPDAQTVDDDAADKLYLGKYKTDEDAEKAMRHWQSKFDQASRATELVGRYPTLLSALEDPEGSPGLKEHIMAYFNGGSGAPASGDGQDEERPLTRSELKAEMARRDRQAAERDKAVRDYQTQVAQLRKDNPDMTDEEQEMFLESIGSAQVTMSDLYWLQNRKTLEAKARQAGAAETMEQMRRISSGAPAIGATPGSRKALSSAQQQANEIVAAGGRAESDVARELGL